MDPLWFSVMSALHLRFKDFVSAYQRSCGCPILGEDQLLDVKA